MELHVLPFIVFSVVIAMFHGFLSVKLHLESAHGDIRVPPGAELRKVISLSVDRGGQGCGYLPIIMISPQCLPLRMETQGYQRLPLTKQRTKQKQTKNNRKRGSAHNVTHRRLICSIAQTLVNRRFNNLMTVISCHSHNDAFHGHSWSAYQFKYHCVKN